VGVWLEECPWVQWGGWKAPQKNIRMKETRPEIVKKSQTPVQRQVGRDNPVKTLPVKLKYHMVRQLFESFLYKNQGEAAGGNGAAWCVGKGGGGNGERHQEKLPVHGHGQRLQGDLGSESNEPAQMDVHRFPTTHT